MSINPVVRVIQKFDEGNDIELITAGKGKYIYDSNGKKYLDFCSGIWNVPFGYTNENINEKVIEQLNTLPFWIARGIGRVGKGVFKGFKTAALLTLGIGVISVEAVQNAKHAIEKASSLSIKDTVNNGRENANKVLDKLEEKIMAQNQQLEEMQNQHTHQLQTDGR